MAPRQMLRMTRPPGIADGLMNTEYDRRRAGEASPRTGTQRFSRVPGDPERMVGQRGGAAKQVVDVDGRRIALTNLDKVLYPASGFTKGDVLAYYAAVASALVPLAAGRPATRKRWPEGVGTEE